MMQLVLLATNWWIMIQCSFKNQLNQNLRFYKEWSIFKLIIVIISVATITAALMTLANLYIFFPLMGLGNLIKLPFLLWIHFIFGIIINIMSIILFLVLIPTITKINKNAHR